MRPAKDKFTIFKQMVEVIPAYLVPKLARKHNVEKRCRSISALSHVLSMMFAHHSHGLSLNDVCDILRFHENALSTIRNAKASSRNGLSHVNRVRPASMAKELFYEVLHHLTTTFQRFGRIDSGFKLP